MIDSNKIKSQAFINNSRKSRTKKDFHVFLFLSSLFISSIYVYTYLMNNPVDSSDFPIVRILCENEIDSDELIECTFELECDDKFESIEPLKAKIKYRGGKFGVSSYPKKGFRIKLSQEKSLLGMRSDDDWNLYALYLDYPRMRIKVAFDLYDTLKPLNPTAISIESQYVGVYFNGEFQGLYLLAQRYNRRLFGLDDPKNNINSSLIIQAKNRASFRENSLDRYWEQDWPNEDNNNIMDPILDDLSNFIINSPDDVFFCPNEGICAKFNKLNLIDFYIFNFFIDHRDFWNKNYYLVRNSHPSQFFLIPCDYDGSFGQYGWIKYDVHYNTERDAILYNALYSRLLKNEDFKKECKMRWFKIRNELWNEEFLLDLISDTYEEIKDFLEEDATMWNPATEVYFNEKWKNNVNENFEDFIEYIPERLKYCDLYFENI